MLGSFCALATAVSFGLNPPLARLAYDGGSNPATVVLLRTLFGVLAAWALAKILRKSLTLPRRALLPTLGVSFSLFAMSLCYLGSVLFIPVSLAGLLFYTFPLMVAAYVSIRGRAKLGWVRAAAFGAAFCGLVLALGSEINNLDWRGIILALSAAGSMATLLVLISRAPVAINTVALSFYSNLGSIPFLVVAVLTMGGLSLPTEETGWLGLSGACVTYAVAVLIYYAAVRLAGPLRTALLLNLEPLITIGAAVILLGESLTPVQSLGVAMVICALVASESQTQPT